MGQAVRSDSIHAWRVSAMRYAGTLAPSHMRNSRPASRLSGGVVITTYAAAIPAAARTRLAVVRAEALVMAGQPFRGPLAPEPDGPGVVPELPG
jgi:hypothetical protein